LTAAEFAESQKPIFYARMRLGDFDPVEMNPYSKIDMSIVLSPEHRELAVQAASMSFVLLKNVNGYLPIKKHYKRIAVGFYWQIDFKIYLMLNLAIKFRF